MSNEVTNLNEYMGEDLKRYIASIKEIPRIDSLEEQRLSEIILNSQDQNETDIAIEKLSRANLMLVVKMAINYYKFVSKGPFGMSIMDLIAEGNMALIRASETFDASQSKFSTYSSYYIRRSFQNYKMNSSMIKVPVNHITILNAVKRIESENRDITMSDKETMAEKFKCSLEQIDFIISCSDNSVISSNISDENGEGSIFDNYPSECKNATEKIIEDERDRYIMKNIDTLSPVEKEIVIERFFKDKHNTVVSIANEKGVSRQRISKILKRAMDKLKCKMETDNFG